MKYIILHFGMFISICVNAQQCDYCLQIDISASHKKITLDSLKYFEITYTITNCSDIDFVYYLEDYPHKEAYAGLYFNIYRPSSGYISWYWPDDVGCIVKEPTEKKLKKEEKFVYHFKLVKYYEIESKGRYYIQGFYKRGIFDNATDKSKGYYIQCSTEIRLDVI